MTQQKQRISGVASGLEDHRTFGQSWCNQDKFQPLLIGNPLAINDVQKLLHWNSLVTPPPFGKEIPKKHEIPNRKVRQDKFQFSCFCVDPAGLAWPSAMLRFCCLLLQFYAYFNIPNELQRPVSSAGQDCITFWLDYSLGLHETWPGNIHIISLHRKYWGWHQNVHPLNWLIFCMYNAQAPSYFSLWKYMAVQKKKVMPSCLQCHWKFS